MKEKFAAKFKTLNLKKYLCLSVFIGGSFFFFNLQRPDVSAENSTNEIEKAIFTRQEFFGASALVPIPTAEARENLSKIAENSPDDPKILEKLAEFDEKLARFDEAEKKLIRLSEIDASKRENLAAFYHRRAEFEKEADIFKQILFSTKAENRAYYFERLTQLARRHDLPQYLNNDFFGQIAKESPDLFDVFASIIKNLTETENYEEALKFVRLAKAQFPGNRNFLLRKEVDLLLSLDKAVEAEKLYQAAFDPLWDEKEAEKFYEFLDNRDRLRAYGAEIKARFRQNPADFDAAIRLALYQNHDNEYGNDSAAPIILRLEQNKKSWTTEELVTATRILLRANDAELASRFLYTLYVREDFRQNSELRAKILYQLFEMFSDAETRKLPITKGDLSFYEDIAKADVNPGITTGILSLIFSDSDPRAELRKQETAANRYFNRAAAYRIFEEYKEENPNSPELARMYLDIIQLYTATQEPGIAEKTLNEFAEKYADSRDFADAALKLADAFIAVENEEKAREIYQKNLDFLGKQGKFHAVKKQETYEDFDSEDEETNEKVSPDKTQGINIPTTEKPQTEYYTGESEGRFHDYLAQGEDEIVYADILEKLVSLYSKDKKTGEILALYSNEIRKYPNQEWLYEERLAWLEQTSLTEEKLEFYKLALEKFQTRSWQDKLARFFVREKWNDDFVAFSEDLMGKLNDEEVADYLSKFAEPKQFQGELEKQIYFKLYTSAHEKFPHNVFFVSGLLQFYKNHGQPEDWRKLCAEYYFESKEIREIFLDHLAEKGELRAYLENAEKDSGIYELFRADAFVRLSNYENAIPAYRKLNEIYPNSPEFSERLISFTRSFGQKNREILSESATLAKNRADISPSDTVYQTTSGEIFAELGDYKKAREEWRKLIGTERGEKEIYLETATVFWDYFQYDDALETIRNLRAKHSDDTLYAFETGALYEARHEQDQAIAEYIKALGATGEDENQKSKAVNRLAVLASRSKENARQIEIAFANKKDKNADYVSLGFAEYLFKTKNYGKGEDILSKAIGNSSDEVFLADVHDFYQSNEWESGKKFAPGKQSALKRLAETADVPRLKIKYSLELSESLQENNEREKAKNILQNLVRQFPTNYGVLAASSARLGELGFEKDAAKILQNALPKSKSVYRNSLAGKLSKILIRTNQTDSAERILVELHAGNPGNKNIFRELVKVCIRTGKAELMRKSFAETVVEIKKSDEERRFIDEEIAELRSEMIDAFTRLKDYKSAVEQHIEIINREPENEELTESAIRYVQRYGGAETLLNYYLKTSAEAFKNYRWNLVLARIYEANNDLEKAAENYKTAIQNQPEMFELYLSLAEVEAKRSNFEAAIENINEVLTLTNDRKEYVKKKIELLKKAGRFAEIEAEKAKLPEEEEKKIVTDEFAEAQKLQFSEKEKARELFRAAFAKLLENPITEEFSAANISACVASLREEEPLDRVNQNLWNLREKLVEIGSETNSTDSGEARKRLQILESAMTEAVGNIVKTTATDEEVRNLHKFLADKIEENSSETNSIQTFSLAQNMSRRAGFGDLEEKILIRKIEENSAFAEKQIHLQNLANFYNARGAYQRTFDALEKYESSDSLFKAEMARIVGNKQKEIEYLHNIYWKTGEDAPSLNDENLIRFFEILYAENRGELKALTEKNTRYQLQLINFLLGKGERELTHTAIQNSAFSEAWKVSRHAETSLALKEFDDRSECYFCDALQFDSIGNLTVQTPDKKRFLINDDWFRLSRQYGEWLLAKDDKTIPPAKFLSAMLENQPKNALEQFKLGKFYFEKNELKPAIEHLSSAVELEPQNTEFWVNLGALYLKAGKADFAEKCFEKTLSTNSYESYRLYFQTLERYGFAEKAREKMQSKIVEALEKADVDNYQELQELVRSIAASFRDDGEKSAYFKEILRQRPTDKSLTEMLLDENLLGKNSQNEFFRILISRLEKFNRYDYDYDFRSIFERVWSQADAESVYEQENDFQVKEPQNERIEWQRKYLELLLEQQNKAEAEKIIAGIEADLNGKFVRPVWLRTAQINLQIRGGKVDFDGLERFTGIYVSDSATEIIPPNVERFNAILEVLKAEGSEAEILRLKENFFARMLALEQLETANFAGFARVLFEKGDSERALQVLRLMTSENRETALSEISEFAEIKAKSANSAKLQNGSDSFPARSDSLKTAAEIASEFRQNETAIEFSRKLAEIVPNDFDNKVKLAEILAANDKKAEGFAILHGIIADRNALRAMRWQARKILADAGEAVELPNDKFDSFSQFYNGSVAQKSAQREFSIEFFLSALIADQETQIIAKQELIKIYAVNGHEILALKIAEDDKTPKSDDLLQILSEAAERIGNFQKAVEFENTKTSPNAEKIANLRKLNNVKNQKATDFTVDAENTKKI
ncbi:MAG: tetratricopeptide repeat protein [Pyrinomonadaceae bacterium]|nr:tetratricopeptide repeat protein [Pyrinomonadaceae bacterium]